jgi:hypothetical protein
MDSKANLANRKKINELAIQHNKLTTLVACLLNEIAAIKKSISTGNVSNIDNTSTQKTSQSNKYPNFNDLRAEDILKQLSINTPDN